MPKFFSHNSSKAKPEISFADYMESILILAKRIKADASGDQLYTSAQLELALIAFADIEALEKEMDPSIKVELPKLTCDWLAGFDWLDLSVSYHDEDAINYFKQNLQNESFQKAYQHYKTAIRPDCSLMKHESQEPQNILN